MKGKISRIESALHLKELFSEINVTSSGFIRIKDADVDRYREKVLEDLVNSIENGDTIYFSPLPNGNNVILKLEELPWDSKVFGIRMGKLHIFFSGSNDHEKVLSASIAEISTIAKEIGFFMLVTRINTISSSLLHALEASGFRVMDSLIDFYYDFRINPPVEAPMGNLPIRVAEETDKEKLIHVAERAFKGHFGHYHSDPFLRELGSTKVYSEWITGSFEGWADKIFIAYDKQNIAGYSIWKLEDAQGEYFGLKRGAFSIAAIDPDYYGRGLFKTLTSAGMHWMQSRVEILSGPTHINNFPVQRGYTSLGWKAYDAYHTLHIRL